MDKRIINFLLVLFLSFQLIWLKSKSIKAENSAEKPSAKTIMEKNKEKESAKTEEVAIALNLINKRGKKRIRKIRQFKKVYDDNTEKMLIIFDFPMDVKGTKLLNVQNKEKEDDQWFYLPALKRVRRISASQNDDSFMGSDFFFEDLRTENLNEFKYTLLGTETFDGVECYLIEALPKTEKKKKDSAYSKRELWIAKENFIILQGKYYDLTGELLKIIVTSDIQPINGTDKIRYHKVDVHNVQINHRTELFYKNYKIDQGLQDNFFTYENLTKE